MPIFHFDLTSLTMLWRITDWTTSGSQRSLRFFCVVTYLLSSLCSSAQLPTKDHSHVEASQVAFQQVQDAFSDVPAFWIAYTETYDNDTPPLKTVLKYSQGMFYAIQRFEASPSKTLHLAYDGKVWQRLDDQGRMLISETKAPLEVVIGSLWSRFPGCRMISYPVSNHYGAFQFWDLNQSAPWKWLSSKMKNIEILRDGDVKMIFEFDNLKAEVVFKSGDSFMPRFTRNTSKLDGTSYQMSVPEEASTVAIGSLRIPTQIVGKSFGADGSPTNFGVTLTIDEFRLLVSEEPSEVFSIPMSSATTIYDASIGVFLKKGVNYPRPIEFPDEDRGSD